MATLAVATPTSAQSLPAFAPPVTYPAPGASAVASGDMNGDGRIDVVTANGATPGSHGVSVLLSNGNGTFQPAANFVTNTDPIGLVVADFNGDGKLDVATADKAAGTLSILLGNGDGTLQQAIAIPVSSPPNTIQTADLNNDGKADLVVVQVAINPATGATTVLGNILLSNGDGSFSQNTFPMNGGVLGLGDFNGDGKIDIFTYHINLTQALPLIRFGNGDGTFTDCPLPFSTNGLNFYVANLVAGDFNSDGKMDIYGEFASQATLRGGGGGTSETMALGNGDGTFTVILLPNNVDLGGQNMITGDFNRDGKLDVAGLYPGPIHFGTGLFPPYQVRIIFGNGDGTMTPPISFLANNSQSVFTGNPLVSADFDGNGFPDFALPTTSGLSVIRSANGNPPLISKLALNANWIVGGANNALGTILLGDPAPAAGVQVTLTTSDTTAATFPGGATLTIPAGSASATFTVATGVVAAASLVSITATSSGSSQVATFNVVPAYTLSSIVTNVPSAYGLIGGGTGTSGTISLTSPAIEGVAVSVTSSDPTLVVVSPLVTVLPGATTVSFTAMVTNKVAVNTPVTISATLDGITKSTVFNVLTATDVIRITKAEYVVSTNTWKIEGTASNPAATLRVLTAAGTGTGPFGGVVTLTPTSNGTFKGQSTAPPPFTSVIVQSSLGGFATSPVTQK